MKTKTIKIDRDSICMGDDCESHEELLTINEEMTMISLFEYLAEYVPTMYNVIWAIRFDNEICGYIINDEKGHSTFEIDYKDQKVIHMKFSEIMCKHYYPSSFSWIDGKTGKRIHKYNENLTFFQKVKKDNES